MAAVIERFTENSRLILEEWFRGNYKGVHTDGVLGPAEHSPLSSARLPNPFIVCEIGLDFGKCFPFTKQSIKVRVMLLSGCGSVILIEHLDHP
jgi:hypothetical protein